MTDQNFKSSFRNAPLQAGNVHEMRFQLASPQTIVSSFILGRISTNLEAASMGISSIWAGTDTDYNSPELKKCSADFFDSGFYELSAGEGMCTGDVVIIRKTAQSTDFNIPEQYINDFRVYQTPNLLLEQLGKVFISAVTPIKQKYSA